MSLSKKSDSFYSGVCRHRGPPVRDVSAGSEFVSNILEISAFIHKLGRGQINIHLNTFQIQTKSLQIAAYYCPKIVRQTMVKSVHFHSPRTCAKSLQNFGPSSHELPIRVCENTGGSGGVTWPAARPMGPQFPECSLGGRAWQRVSAAAAATTAML